MVDFRKIQEHNREIAAKKELRSLQEKYNKTLATVRKFDEPCKIKIKVDGVLQEIEVKNILEDDRIPEAQREIWTAKLQELLTDIANMYDPLCIKMKRKLTSDEVSNGFDLSVPVQGKLI